MSRALQTKEDLVGCFFGKLEVICCSDKRGLRGARTVALWECHCDYGNITYKVTETLTPPSACVTIVSANMLDERCEKRRATLAELR